MEFLKDLPSPCLRVHFEVCPLREPYSIVRCYSAVVLSLVVEVHSVIEVCLSTERSFVKRTFLVLELCSEIGLSSASALYLAMGPSSDSAHCQARKPSLGSVA